MKQLHKDILADVVGGIVLVPGAKSVISHFFDQCLPPDLDDPNTLWSQTVKGNPEAKEKLGKALYGLAQTFMETSDAEKKAVLRAAANSYMRTPAHSGSHEAGAYQTIMADAYLTWVRELSDIHIKLLAGARDLNALRETATAITGGVESPYAMHNSLSVNGKAAWSYTSQWDYLDAGRPGPMGSTTGCPTARLVERCWDDLREKGLVHLPAKYVFHEAKLSDLGMNKDLRGPEAREFLSYIGVQAERRQTPRAST